MTSVVCLYDVSVIIGVYIYVIAKHIMHLVFCCHFHNINYQVQSYVLRLYKFVAMVCSSFLLTSSSTGGMHYLDFNLQMLIYTWPVYY